MCASASTLFTENVARGGTWKRRLVNGNEIEKEKEKTYS
jgi:hypothetical protein